MRTYVYDQRGTEIDYFRLRFSGSEYLFHPDTPIRTVAIALSDRLGADDALTVLLNHYLPVVNSAECTVCQRETLVIIGDGLCLICGSSTSHTVQ